MALVVDTFTDTDGTQLASHTPETGGPWVTPTGMFPQWATIVSNKADGAAGAGASQRFYVDAGQANVSVALALSTTASGNFMSFRVGGSAADFSGGQRFRLNRFDNTLEWLASDNSVIATLTPGTAVGTGEYSGTLTWYKGHGVASFSVGGTTETVHGWAYDVLRGWTFPTGTYYGPDWTATNAGTLDTLTIDTLARASATHFSIIGDSTGIFNRTASLWPQRVAETFNSGVTQLRSLAQGGEGLSKGGTSGLTANDQASAILTNSDDPDYVLVHIGTNDDPTSVTATGQTVQQLMDTVLGTLLTGGIAASKIKVLNILPTTVNESYNPANRTAIAAACTARSVTCWDTSTWIDPTAGVDTSDGLHPNASGSAKITTEVLALLQSSAGGTPSGLTLLRVG